MPFRYCFLHVLNSFKKKILYYTGCPNRYAAFSAALDI